MEGSRKAQPDKDDDGTKNAVKGTAPMDGSDKLNLHVDFTDFRFIRGKGFNIAGRLRTCITARQAYDKHFAIMAMIGDGQGIMWAADVPTTTVK
jgi:hypothetical protein